MLGTTPPTSQLDWLISTTAMIVLFWSRATRDLLKSFGWGIAALHRLVAATKLPSSRRPSHSISPLERDGFELSVRGSVNVDDDGFTRDIIRMAAAMAASARLARSVRVRTTQPSWRPHLV